MDVSVVPPSDTCRNSSIRGAWRLAARVPRQEVWKRISLGSMCVRIFLFS